MASVNVTIIPALDLLDGRCVRLTQGSYTAVSVYDDDPASVAKRFEEAGARRIHVVDLDAARSSGNNRKLLSRIRRSVSAVIEVGGGVRTDDDVAELVDAGIDRIIVGTLLARDPEQVARWCAGGKAIFLAGIDARDGAVMVQGWESGTSIEDIALARQAREIGCAGIIYTSISRDGMLSGPDIERTNMVAVSAHLPVVLSGGISSASDIAAVIEHGEPGIRGIVVGKALYAGKVDLAAALEMAEASRPDDEDEVSW
ncbi:MAG TPA: 1-(5-phosphoribosyl)-5-[(5-phosphoribosylamino)methylideneamino] imidazole-4-carboxamide isomerase [Spirochaetia bacterium]|nr:1-(5-phosphoribosyl)-5-[(5-phosphoribosylamino)methylideneamino] imidazole-4-carboxamide isomerase [Spirochaetia bacterium]